MSCADVCLDHGYDCEPNTFFGEKTVTARKAHKCCECRCDISPGDRYELARGLMDQRFWVSKSCAACAEIRTAFVCGSWIYGNLWESVREEMFPIFETHSAVDCLAKLTTQAARDLVMSRYEQWKVGGGAG